MNRLKALAAACAVAIVVLVVALAGGGGKNATLVSGSALAQAARATERVPGASTSFTSEVKTDGLSQPLRVDLHGIENIRQRAADLVGTYENFPKKVPGESANGTVPVEGITILPDLYMRSPLYARAGVPSGKWLHIDFAKAGKKLGLGDPTQFASSTDPSQSVQVLRALSSRVENRGTEDVRGVATTHYAARVELRRLPAVTPPAKRAAARKFATRLISLIGTDSYPLEAWVDKRHLVRRMRMNMTMKIQGRSITQDMTIELYDFGPKQKIKAPPTGDTIDASKLAGAGSGP